jgi:NTE family protein
MSPEEGSMRKIGLCLSGGGFRATVFHLGVLARLAEQRRLEDVELVSTVSGGSLAAALVMACNGMRWPTSAEYLDRVLPAAREKVTTQDLQGALIGDVLRFPLRLFHTRADEMSRELQERWAVTGRLSDLPEHPRWIINSTCYETGRNWRFERDRMGDSSFGHSADTWIPISDAVAASCGFPGLVGPLVLDTRQHSWKRPEGRVRSQLAFRRLHLWDGGVCDNLGVEGMHSFLNGWEQNVDLLMISDGCARVRPEPYRTWKAADRLIRGLMLEEIRSLRFRAIVERARNHDDQVCYFLIGSSCQDVLRFTGREGDIERISGNVQSDRDRERAAYFGTTIRRLRQSEFECLFRHGFEVADYTMYGCYPERFRYLGYDNSQACLGQPEPVRRHAWMQRVRVALQS